MQRLIDANAFKRMMYTDKGFQFDKYGNIQTNVNALNIALERSTIDAVPLDGSFLKMSRGDYLIYNRHWLYEHFDMEMEIQRSAMKSMGYEYVGKNTDTVRHGRWIIRDNPGTGWYRVTCSECGEDVTSNAPCIGFFPNAKVLWNYCPNCGARMDKE